MLRDDLFSMAFLKKSRFTGSFQGMCYRLGEIDDALMVWVFPGPYAFDYTPEECKESQSFPFTPEGYEQAKDWLEEKAASRDWLLV